MASKNKTLEFTFTDVNLINMNSINNIPDDQESPNELLTDNCHYVSLIGELEDLFRQKKESGDKTPELDALIESKLKALKNSFEDIAKTVAAKSEPPE